MKNLAIMQPYFLPHIGYFQLIAAVDLFIVYDTIKYTKKGWINRNRLLQNGKNVMFSLPLKRDSDSLDVCERELAADFNREKLLNQFKDAYRRAPYLRSRRRKLIMDIAAHTRWIPWSGGMQLPQGCRWFTDPEYSLRRWRTSNGIDCCKPTSSPKNIWKAATNWVSSIRTCVPASF